MIASELVAAPGNPRQAWTAGSLDAQDAWYYALDAAALAELDAVVAHLRRGPRPIVELRPDAFTLDAARAAVAPAHEALEAGRGFAVIDGLDLTRYRPEEATALYWLVGQLLGEPFPQNVQGTLLYDVRDTGQSVEYGARFSVTNAESSFHTDNSFGDTVLDYVGLLCLKTARSGGLSQNVSGYTAMEVLRREAPRALEVLRQPFHVDRRGGVQEGEAPTAQVPVLGRHREQLLVRYLRYWIEVGHRKAGVPLSESQLHPLDTLDAVAGRPELRAEFALRPGQMFFLNNRWILHNRTAFEDHPDPEARRHLVRLWLRAREP